MSDQRHAVQLTLIWGFVRARVNFYIATGKSLNFHRHLITLSLVINKHDIIA